MDADLPIHIRVCLSDALAYTGPKMMRLRCSLWMMVCLFCGWLLTSHGRAQTQAMPRPLPRSAPTGSIVIPNAVTATNTVDPLAWDSMRKEFNAQTNQVEAKITYAVTNVSTAPVIIKSVRPSCGCTVVKLPATPWTLKPGDGGLIDVDVDLRGKRGTLNKYIAVDSSCGFKVLNLRVNIPDGPGQTNAAAARSINLKVALGDRQAVFKGECVICHVRPTVGRKGLELFDAACGICHDSSHRASMVPDLKTITLAGTREYWRDWISRGRPGTLMPAFAYSEGGVLSKEQIESLVAYLTSDFAKLRQAVAAASKPKAGPAAVKPAVSKGPPPAGSDLKSDSHPAPSSSDSPPLPE